MKIYVKIITVSFILVAFSQSIFAQSRLIGGIAIPSGTDSELLENGYGAEYSWLGINGFYAEGLSLGFSIGYYHYQYVDEFFFDGSVGVVSLLGTVDYKILRSDISPYAVGSVGFYQWIDIEDSVETNGSIGVKLGGGLRFGLSKKFAFNTEVSYNINRWTNYVALGGGISF